MRRSTNAQSVRDLLAAASAMNTADVDQIVASMMAVQERAAPPPPQPEPVPVNPVRSRAEQLIELNELLAQNLITAEEHARLRLRVLES